MSDAQTASFLRITRSGPPGQPEAFVPPVGRSGARRHNLATLASPRRPSNTMRIFPSAQIMLAGCTANVADQPLWGGPGALRVGPGRTRAPAQGTEHGIWIRWQRDVGLLNWDRPLASWSSQASTGEANAAVTVGAVTRTYNKSGSGFFSCFCSILGNRTGLGSVTSRADMWWSEQRVMLIMRPA